MNKKLLASRIFNDTGDWFYYFVIVVIIYTMNKSPVMMGILSASYTIPGILVSKKLAELIDRLDDRKALIMFDGLRIFVLSGIVFTNNIWLALLCVFLEQIFAIGSNLAFQRVTLDVITDSQKLLVFNRQLKIFSNGSRLLVIPSYLIMHQFISNKLILGLDILFTLISLIETIKIKVNPLQVPLKGETNECKLEKLRFGNKITKTIVIFSLLNLFRAFVDAYGIMYISNTSKNVNFGYAMLVFILSIADLIGGIVSKKIIKKSNIDQNSILIISFINILIFFSIPSIIHNMECFIGCIFLLRLGLSILELFVLYRLQLYAPQKIHQYIALQTMLIDGVSLINSILGGVIIQKINIFNYMNIIILIVLVSGIFFGCIQNKKRPD